jgi:hypothetical protein
MLIDLEELRNVVENADVFTIGFRLFPERLLIDTRNNDDVTAMVRVVEPVTSVEERFFWLGKERPAFGVPESFSFFVWPHSLRYYEESGLSAMVRNRVGSAAGDQVDEAIQQLIHLERLAERDAITGRNYHSLWEAAPAG